MKLSRLPVVLLFVTCLVTVSVFAKEVPEVIAKQEILYNFLVKKFIPSVTLEDLNVDLGNFHNISIKKNSLLWLRFDMVEIFIL